MGDAAIALSCFYRLLSSGPDSHSTSSNIVQDIIPEHLHLHPGSRPWVEQFVRALAKIAVEDLAADDRDCGVRKDVNGEDVSATDRAPK